LVWLPPPRLGLLPAGTTPCRVGFAPTEQQRLCTAHTLRHGHPWGAHPWGPPLAGSTPWVTRLGSPSQEQKGISLVANTSFSACGPWNAKRRGCVRGRGGRVCGTPQARYGCECRLSANVLTPARFRAFGVPKTRPRKRGSPLCAWMQWDAGASTMKVRPM
jgi:hypothetical protein